MQTSYLRFGPANVTTIEGIMEGVPHDAFSGWLWNTADARAELAVEVVGPGFYARVSAAEQRYDLAAAGKRDGNCWFKVQVPRGMLEAVRAETVALLAGTSHRLPSLKDASQTLDVGWLDRQPLELQLAVSAQRIRGGLDLPPLSETQLAGVIAASTEDGFDLGGLVRYVANLTRAAL